MNRREALGRVIVLLARAADAAHAAGWTELGLAIESALYDAQRRYRALTSDDAFARGHEPPRAYQTWSRDASCDRSPPAMP
jgi:hypothetical protein